MRNKIEKTHVKEKIIIRTREYLCSSAICLCPQSCRDFTIIREEIQSTAIQFFSLHGLNLRKSPIKNHATSFQVGLLSGSNTTRLHKIQQISYLETSSITDINRNPPKTIPHPCNSSSCP